MFRNVVSITARTIIRYPLYSLINIAGLAVGLAAVVIILLFVRYEFSYDRHLEGHEQIYRVSRMFHAPNSATLDLATIAGAAAPLLTSDFEEIEASVRLLQSNVLFSQSDVKLYVPKTTFADENVFDVLPFEFIRGDASSAFSGPAAVIVTESTARKLFGTTDVIGQTLTLTTTDSVITAVIADMPENSHFAIDALAPMQRLVDRFGQGFLERWGNNSFQTYLRLTPGADIDDVRNNMDDFLVRHIGSNAIMTTTFVFQPLTDIHLHSNRQSEMKPNGSITNVYMLIAISSIVLAIACINFVNLTTARAAQRAREVGLRKAIGATRQTLVRQFLGEATGIAFLALMGAIAIVEIGLPSFNAFMGAEIEFNYVTDPVVLGGFIAVLLTVGAIAGSYPALVLSAFQPATVLKGAQMTGGSGSTLRRLLVIGQFTVSVVLMIATGIVYMQVQYARDFAPGYEIDQRLIVAAPRGPDPLPIYEAFRNELAASPDILSVAAGSRMPTTALLDGDGFRLIGGEDSTIFSFRTLGVDYGFFETFGIDIVEGRSFSREFGADDITGDGGSALINARAAEILGFNNPATAIGQRIGRFVGTDDTDDFTIVGVVDDVQFTSVHSEVEPLVAMRMPNRFNFFGIHLKTTDIGAALRTIDQAWANAAPQFPIVRSFLDENFAALYRDEERQGQIFTIFASLAILIACLGLFGLASFSAERREKEIGIRKSLGATGFSVVRLLTSEFAVLVLVANLIAWPLAWYAMGLWLDGFAYRVSMSPTVFLAAGIVSIVIALATVGIQAARSAAMSPAISLRND